MSTFLTVDTPALPTYTLGILHLPVHSFFKKAPVFCQIQDAENGNLKFEIRKGMPQFFKIQKTSVCIIPGSYPLQKTSEGFDRLGAFFKTIKFRISNNFG